MKHRASLVLGLALILSAGGFLTAQDAVPAATAAASIVPEDQQPTDTQLNRLFEVMRVKDQMASMAKMMPQFMQQQMNAQLKQMEQDHPEMSKMTPPQQKAFSDAIGKFMQKAMTLYTTDDMLADMKGIYKKYLSQSDVENIITFYSSSSGQRILAMVPVIMQEYMPLVMHKTEERMKPMMQELQLELAQIIAKPASTPAEPKQ